MYLNNKDVLLSRRSSQVSRQLPLILGVCISVFVILLIATVIVIWRWRSQKAKQDKGSTASHTQPSVSGSSEKTRVTQYHLPIPPKVFQPVSSIPSSSPPAPITPPTASTFVPGSSEGSTPHYQTWRTASTKRTVGRPDFYENRTSAGEKGLQLEARSAHSASNDMSDLITLLNSRRVGNSNPPSTYELASKPMRPISVDSLSAPTIVASHTGSREFDDLKIGHFKSQSLDKAGEEGSGSEGSVPSVLRKPKYNPVTGAPMIPSIYFDQSFELGAEQVSVSRQNSRATAGGPSRRPSQRAPSSLSRSRTQTSFTTKAFASDVLVEVPMEETATPKATESSEQNNIRSTSMYTAVSRAPSASVYPESSRTSVETADRSISAPRVAKEARRGWI